MIEFVEFRDDRISVRLPKQLRQKRGMRFFSGRRLRNDANSQIVLSIEIDLPPKALEAEQRLLETIQRHMEMQGVITERLRGGPCRFGEGGIEILGVTRVTVTGQVLYNWRVICSVGGSLVRLVISAGAIELADFESMGGEIMTSLRFLTAKEGSASANRPPAPGTRETLPEKGMPAKAKARLIETLRLLPTELEYLRVPILSIADQDQDLLGSGEGDTEQLSIEIDKQAKTRSKDFSKQDAKRLKKWLAEMKGSKQAWARSAYFVEGFLRGYNQFAAR